MLDWLFNRTREPAVEKLTDEQQVFLEWCYEQGHAPYVIATAIEVTETRVKYEMNRIDKVKACVT